MLQFLYNWVSTLFYHMKRLRCAWMLSEFLRWKKYIFITQRGYVRHKDIAVSNHDQFCDAEAITSCFFKFVQAQNTPIDSCIDWLRKYQTNRENKCDFMLPW